MRLIRIPDQDCQHEHDVILVIPAQMESQEAIRLVDAAILKAKEKEDYIFDDLMAELTPLGFVSPSCFKSNEPW